MGKKEENFSKLKTEMALILQSAPKVFILLLLSVEFGHVITRTFDKLKYNEQQASKKASSQCVYSGSEGSW